MLIFSFLSKNDLDPEGVCQVSDKEPHTARKANQTNGKWSKMERDARRKERIYKQRGKKERERNYRQSRSQSYPETKKQPEELYIAAAELMRWNISQGKEPRIDKGRKKKQHNSIKGRKNKIGEKKNENSKCKVKEQKKKNG